jgi:hypothetical protein
MLPRRWDLHVLAYNLKRVMAVTGVSGCSGRSEQLLAVPYCRSGSRTPILTQPLTEADIVFLITHDRVSTSNRSASRCGPDLTERRSMAVFDPKQTCSPPSAVLRRKSAEKRSQTCKERGEAVNEPAEGTSGARSEAADDPPPRCAKEKGQSSSNSSSRWHCQQALLQEPIEQTRWLLRCALRHQRTGETALPSAQRGFRESEMDEVALR